MSTMLFNFDSMTMWMDWSAASSKTCMALANISVMSSRVTLAAALALWMPSALHPFAELVALIFRRRHWSASPKISLNFVHACPMRLLLCYSVSASQNSDARCPSIYRR